MARLVLDSSLNREQSSKTKKLILWLDRITNDDVALVGGKNASLGEMYIVLSPQGIRNPNAFVVTAQTYRIFVEKSGLSEVIHKELDDLDTSDIKALQKREKRIRKAFLKVRLPEDLPGASFVWEHETFLNVSQAKVHRVLRTSPVGLPGLLKVPD